MYKFTLIPEFDGYQKLCVGSSQMGFADFQKIKKSLESAFEVDSNIASIKPRVENFEECEE